MDISGYELAEILCQAGTAVAATLEREEAIERILEQLAQVVPHDSASVQLLREGYLEIVGGRGWSDPDSVVGLRFPVPGDNPNTVVIKERRPYILGDAPGPYATFVGTSSHIRSWLGVPLIIHDQVIGMLSVDSTQPDYFTSDHARLVTAFASQVAVAIENSRLYAQAQERVAELEALQRTSLKLSSSLDLSAVLDSIAESTLSLVGATDCIIYLYDAASDSFSFGIALGGWVDKDRVIAPRPNGVTATVVREGRPVVIDDAVGHPLFSTPEAKEWNIRATAAFPLQRAGRVLGVLHVIFVAQPHTFREEELRVLGLLADQAAIAIENAWLYEEAQREITERARAEEELRVHRDHLEELVEERTADLTEANAQLQQEIAERKRVEAELRVSQEYTRNIIDSSLDSIIAVDRERRVVEFNRAAQETFGYRPEEILGQHADVFYAEPGDGLDVHRTTVEQGNCVREVMNRRKNGEVFPVFLSASPLRDARGELIGVMGVSRDITERVQAGAELRKYQEHLEELVEERTAELRESEERYRTLFDGVPVGLYRSTPAGQMVDANLALVHMLGYPSREELLAISPASLYVAPEDRVRWQALMEREGVVRDFEIQHRRYDGTLIWVKDTARAVRDEGGQVLYYEGSLEDITQRVQAEAELRVYQEHLEDLVEERTAELRQSEERYRTLFNRVPVGLYRTTPDGEILDANLAMAQMLGYPSREEALQAGNTADAYVDPEERLRWQVLMEHEGVVLDFEERVRRYDGTIIWLNDTARAVRDEQGRVLYYEGSLEDITERKEFEEELRLQKDYYEALFINSPVAVVTVDLDANVVSWNPMAEKLFGYTQQEAIGKNLDYLVANDASIRAEAVGYTRQLLEFGLERLQVTTRRTRKDGSLVDVELLVLPVIVAGEMVGIIGIYYDITELKRIERELRLQKDYYEAVVTNSPVAVVTVDLDPNVVSWNPMAEKLFGYTQEEAIGTNLDDLVANDASIRAEAVGYTRQVLEFGLERVQVTTRRTRKDGSLVDVELLGLPVIVAGEMVGYIAIYHDITELKRIERELRLQKDYYEALFINSPVAVLTVDLDANVVSWNPMAEKLFGYTQEEVFGKHLDDLVANDPRVREEALHYTHQALTEGRLQATARRTRKDGSLVDVEVLALPVIVAGEMVGVIVIYYDISELQEARRAAEAANQAKSTFLANMSHELRTPLNAILGFTQLMDRDQTLTAEQEENLGIINRSGEHLLALINDVLDMSKIEAGRVTLQEESFDLYRLLDGLEEMFRLRAEEKGLTLSFERAENVPQYVVTDEAKLRQVLSNLLGNAVKFTQEGGVTLRVRSREYEVGSREPPPPITPSPLLPTPYFILHFEVEDTGPGIPPEDLATVFDPFVQAAGERRTQEGTGLGLSISRQYVRLMGGDLTVCSELEGGCLFKFEVQVGLAEAAKVGAAWPTRRVLGLEPNQPVYRLLVAEDDETNRRLLVRLLKPLGFEVQIVVNGQDAIEIWERWEPHLIWMDMRMPVVDGYEATRYIKSEIQNRKSETRTVIVALTASAFEEDRERMLAEGCDDFVRKPFREDEIFAILAKHLGVRFVYEEIERDREKRQVTSDFLARDRAGLPAGWVSDLQEATIRADLSLILALIDQIREEDPALADVLTDLAHNFQYQEILTSIASTEPEEDNESTPG
jgi:two-component system sensor histidine kinase/response regulator